MAEAAAARICRWAGIAVERLRPSEQDATSSLEALTIPYRRSGATLRHDWRTPLLAKTCANDLVHAPRLRGTRTTTAPTRPIPPVRGPHGSEPEAAWRVTEVNPDWDPSERRWKRLAKAREESYPAQAMAVYLKLADRELEHTGRAYYQRAVALLANARRAADAAGQLRAFSDHLASRREQFRRRPALIEILDRSDLR